MRLHCLRAARVGVCSMPYSTRQAGCITVVADFGREGAERISGGSALRNGIDTASCALVVRVVELLDAS